MADSSLTDLDPRDLILDPLMQAREPELIKTNKEREAQITKQAMQDSEILNDLLNGVGIRLPITVFEVGSKRYVVDGFHRTKACLEFLKEKPEESITIKAMLIKNRTYNEAFLAAQEMNQNHGVGVTNEEITQSKFRSLIVTSQFGLSVSQLMKVASCGRGQADHFRKALLACADALQGISTDKDISVQHLVEILSEQLSEKYYLTSSAWDSKGFPKMRRLSDAYSGRVMPSIEDGEEWTDYQIKQAIKNFNNMIEYYGPGVFREALRKTVRGQELGITISRKSTWEEAQGYSDESNYLENQGNHKEFSIEKDDF